ncbi:MAG: hypothetical protein IJI68_01470 [Eggerthellaceae bacterium]|nr:hypothetical protein [Eggerthellaceae bacterium]
MVIEQREAPAQDDGNADDKPAAEIKEIAEVVVAPAAWSSKNSDDDDYDDDDDWRLEMSENSGLWVFK